MSATPGVRGFIACLASLALLAQVLFAAPLAARMLIDVPLCTSPASTSDHAPAPAAPHTHEFCLVCHGAAVPLALLTAALLLPAPQMRSWQVQAPYHTVARTTSRFWRYRSRAPPALA
jgi:hypothetical protein